MRPPPPEFLSFIRRELRLNIAWQISDAHQLQFQVLDSRNGSVEDTYGNIAADGVENGRAPLVYTLNWNGDFGKGTFKTRWSASVMSEAAEAFSDDPSPKDLCSSAS